MNTEIYDCKMWLGCLHMGNERGPLWGTTSPSSTVKAAEKKDAKPNKSLNNKYFMAPSSTWAPTGRLFLSATAATNLNQLIALDFSVLNDLHSGEILYS